MQHIRLYEFAYASVNLHQLSTTRLQSNSYNSKSRQLSIFAWVSYSLVQTRYLNEKIYFIFKTFLVLTSVSRNYTFNKQYEFIKIYLNIILSSPFTIFVHVSISLAGKCLLDIGGLVCNHSNKLNVDVLTELSYYGDRSREIDI